MWKHHSLGCQSLLGRALIKDSMIDRWWKLTKSTLDMQQKSMSELQKKKKNLAVGDLEKPLQVML